MVEKWETLEKSIFYISCFIIVSGFWNEISKGLNKNKYKELTSTNLTRYSQNRLQFLTKITFLFLIIIIYLKWNYVWINMMNWAYINKWMIVEWIPPLSTNE